LYNLRKKSILHKAIKKYGKDNFAINSIYESTDEWYTSEVMEEYYIREYNSHYLDGHGYNMTYGGMGSQGPRRSTKRKSQMTGSGNIMNNPVTKQKMIFTLSKITYKVCFIDGNSEIFNNLNQWCKDNGYTYSLLRRLMDPESKRHRHKDIIKIEKLNFNN
jgi:hypothetical protein